MCLAWTVVSLHACLEVQIQFGDEFLQGLRGDGALPRIAGRPPPEVDLANLSAKASLGYTYLTGIMGDASVCDWL